MLYFETAIIRDSFFEVRLAESAHEGLSAEPCLVQADFFSANDDPLHANENHRSFSLFPCELCELSVGLVVHPLDFALPDEDFPAVPFH